jgi:curved DNA-binding protein CbpA
MTQEDPREVLGIGPDANDEEIRAAYLRKLKQFPPDRSPRDFERVRDAYEMLRGPRQRARTMLLAANPGQPLVSLLEGQAHARRFTGSALWLAVLTEKKA